MRGPYGTAPQGKRLICCMAGLDGRIGNEGFGLIGSSESPLNLFESSPPYTSAGIRWRKYCAPRRVLFRPPVLF